MACYKREVGALSRQACELACQNNAGCTAMWHPNEPPSDLDRYYYVFDKMNWNEANQFCKNNNSRLAVVETWQDHEELRKITNGTASRMVERIGDVIENQAANKTMEMVGKITQGASVFFSNTAWIGIKAVPSSKENYEFEYVWDGAPELDNLKTGGSPRPNAYNWGWSIEYFKREGRQYSNNPQCGVVERNMWNRRDCDDDLPFICERLGKCEICDGSGEDNSYISVDPVITGPVAEPSLLANRTVMDAERAQIASLTQGATNRLSETTERLANNLQSGVAKLSDQTLKLQEDLDDQVNHTREYTDTVRLPIEYMIKNDISAQEVSRNDVTNVLKVEKMKAVNEMISLLKNI